MSSGVAGYENLVHRYQFEIESTRMLIEADRAAVVELEKKMAPHKERLSELLAEKERVLDRFTGQSILPSLLADVAREIDQCQDQINFYDSDLEGGATFYRQRIARYGLSLLEAETKLKALNGV